MAKDSGAGAVVKTPKPELYAGMKELNKWILRGNLDTDVLTRILEKYKFSIPALVHRLFGYSYSNLKLVQYLDTWFNNLYDFNKFRIQDFLLSYAYTLRESGARNIGDLCLIRSNENCDWNRQKILELFKRYFRDHLQKNLNDEEIRFYYQLYLNEVISNDDVIEIDRYLNNNEKTINLRGSSEINDNGWVDKFDQLMDSPSVATVLARQVQASEEMQNWILEALKKKGRECKECPLFSGFFLPLRSNAEKFSDVKTLVVQLGVSKDDARTSELATQDSKYGEYLNQYLEQLKEPYMVMPCMMCGLQTRPLLKEKDVKDIVQRCSGFFQDLYQKVVPDRVVLVGSTVGNIFGLSGRINTQVGKWYRNFGGCVVMDPTTSLKTESSAINCQKSWNFAFGLDMTPQMGKEKKESSPKVVENVSQNNVVVDTEEQKPAPQMDEIPDDATLFDIKPLSQKEVLMIYIANDGKKLYRTVPYKMKGFIKPGSYQDCQLFDSDIQYYFSMTRQQKGVLEKELLKCLNDLKEVH